MIFAFWHACLGFLAASAVTLILRRHSASARCWAWRLGLLKGPLALLLAIPIVISTASPAPVDAPVSTPAISLLAPFETNATPPPAPFDPTPFMVVVYIAGLAAVVTMKVVALRRITPEMPRVEGILRPQIVLPASLKGHEAEMALAHEQAHVRRRDPAWSLLADIVCAALWFVPPVWLCAAAMRAEAEAACDAEALSSTGAERKAYARLLVSFTGPAPANALGGSARRLARRITMLNRASLSLTRPLAACLLVLGLTILLPWQAVAAPEDPARFDHFSMLAPRSVSLDWAASVMFYEPGVKEKIGWTPHQEVTLRERQKPLERFTQEYGRRNAELQKTATMNERAAYARTAQAEQTRLGREAARIPWTPEQLAQLRAMALQKFGSAVWRDQQVVTRISLNREQLALLSQEEAGIVQAADLSNLFPPVVRPGLPVPPAVQKQVDLAKLTFNATKPGPERERLRKRLSNLLRPYEPLYGNLGGKGVRPLAEARMRTAWKLRREADRKVAARLSDEQRNKLQALTQDPSAWLR